MSAEKIVVAMSGGVDSSVAAYLLKQQGYDPLGVFMCAGFAQSDPGSPQLSGAEPGGPQRCCSPQDSADAREVARQIGIPFAVLDFAADFRRIVDNFCAEYGSGRTPNPCIICNRDLKFGRLLAYADAMGARYISTGHYARVEGEPAPPADASADSHRWRLMRGADRAKDQSYFLFAIPPEQLGRVRLPLGGMTKAEVRAVAREAGLPVHDKEESQDICFVRGSVADLVRERRPDLMRPGPVLDLGGRQIGRHDGIAAFTIGQRRGLGIAVGQPRYVIEIRAADAAVVVGPAEALLARGLVATDVVWHEPPPAGPIRSEVQIRYRHAAAPASIKRTDDATKPYLAPREHTGGGAPGERHSADMRNAASGPPGCVVVEFDEPQPAVTPGQAAVFYRGDCVIGGGWISASVGG